MKLAQLLSSRKPIVQLGRFVFSSLGTVCVKVGLTWAFAQAMPEQVAYFSTHVVVFFWSYFMHVHFTFNESHSGKRMWNYFKAVALIKMADFLIFNLVIGLTDDRVSISVVIASVTMTAIRFVSIRKALMDGAEKRPVIDPDLPL